MEGIEDVARDADSLETPLLNCTMCDVSNSMDAIGSDQIRMN